MLLSMKRKESYLLRLEIFNNIAENIKNSGIVEKFIKELSATLERNSNKYIMNSEKMTTEYRDKMLLERNEILQKYAENTLDKGDMYYIYDKKDSYLATLCRGENSHEVIKISKEELPENATIGSVLRLENQNYVVDRETTDLVKDELENCINSLLEEQKRKMEKNRIEGHLYEFVENDRDIVSLIDVTKDNGEVFEEFDFPLEFLNGINEGDIFEFRDGRYQRD